MRSDELTHDELAKFATLLYGNSWRDELAKHLDISRKQLVLTLAAGDPVPASIAFPFLSLVDEHLQQQQDEQQKMRERLAQIRKADSEEKQPRVSRKNAS